MTDPAPRISEDELARLEELAEKATPGPWMPHQDAVISDHGNGWQLAKTYGVGVVRDRNAAYIAALSPDVVLRFIAAARSAPAVGLDVERLREIAKGLDDAITRASLAAVGIAGWPRPEDRWVPAAALEIVARGLPCPMRSSLTDEPCVLLWGHPADSSMRFHKFAAAPRRRGGPVMGERPFTLEELDGAFEPVPEQQDHVVVNREDFNRLVTAARAATRAGLGQELGWVGTDPCPLCGATVAAIAAEEVR